MKRALHRKDLNWTAINLVTLDYFDRASFGFSPRIIHLIGQNKRPITKRENLPEQNFSQQLPWPNFGREQVNSICTHSNGLVHVVLQQGHTDFDFKF